MEWRRQCPPSPTSPRGWGLAAPRFPSGKGRIGTQIPQPHLKGAPPYLCNCPQPALQERFSPRWSGLCLEAQRRRSPRAPPRNSGTCDTRRAASHSYPALSPKHRGWVGQLHGVRERSRLIPASCHVNTGLGFANASLGYGRNPGLFVM